jgi:hypothetical protein
MTGACNASSQRSSYMRASVILILAVLIAALLAFDSYEYDGRYRKAAIDRVDYEVQSLWTK